MRWGGGGAYLKKRNQIVNVGLIRYASSEDAQGSVSSLPVPEIGTIFNSTRNFFERRRRGLLVGSGGMPPGKVSDLKV